MMLSQMMNFLTQLSVTASIAKSKDFQNSIGRRKAEHPEVDGLLVLVGLLTSVCRGMEEMEKENNMDCCHRFHFE